MLSIVLCANSVSIFLLGLSLSGPARPIDGRVSDTSDQVADTWPERSKIT